MLVYTKEEEGVYALSRIPLRGVGWGDVDADPMRLYVDATKKPVTVWVVGYIATLWLFDPRDGEPNSKISVGVTPLTTHAMSAGRYILERLSHPVTGKYLCYIPVHNSECICLAVDSWLGHISASRWQSERVSGQKKAKVRLFLLPLLICVEFIILCRYRHSRIATMP